MENNSTKPTIYMAGYVMDSTDGMALYSTAAPYFSHEEAVNSIDPGEGVLDYVNNTKRKSQWDDDWDDEDDTAENADEDENGFKPADLPDPYNEGRKCVGYWIIMEGSF